MFLFQSEINRLRETIDSTFAEMADPDEISMEQEMLEQQHAIDPLDTDNSTKPAIEMVPVNDNGSVCDTAEPTDSKDVELLKDRERRKKRKRFLGYVRSRKLKRKLKKSATLDAATASTSNKKCINPLSLDAMNTTIPKLELPYKKFRNAMFEIISQNEILANRTRVNRRTLEPFDYKRITTKQQIGAPKKNQRQSLPNAVVSKAQPDRGVSPAAAAVKDTYKNKSSKKVRLSSSGLDSSGDDNHLSQTCGSRNKRRINYSEELVDEAFMYEQLLHDKQHQQQKRKQSLTKSLEPKSLDGALDAAVNSAAADAAYAAAATATPGNLDSKLRLLERRNEISIMPVKSRLMAKEKSKTDVMGGHRPIPIKTEPLFNITSSVSVHIKSRPEQLTAAALALAVAPAAAAATAASQSIQISNITSLHGMASPSPKAPSRKRRKIACDHCQRPFSDEKQLAIHQLVHMTISAYKIDAVRILHPKLRRVSNTVVIHPLFNERQRITHYFNLYLVLFFCRVVC